MYYVLWRAYLGQYKSMAQNYLLISKYCVSKSLVWREPKEVVNIFFERRNQLLSLLFTFCSLNVVSRYVGVNKKKILKIKWSDQEKVVLSIVKSLNLAKYQIHLINNKVSFVLQMKGWFCVFWTFWNTKKHLLLICRKKKKSLSVTRFEYFNFKILKRNCDHIYRRKIWSARKSS